ncbi:hypothetical protein JTB14_010243 [Gonioctena quinquepunctata]|nr:hypothetical protein JTB14_010243 [Gonioctena quinquepunctata]
MGRMDISDYGIRRQTVPDSAGARVYGPQTLFRLSKPVEVSANLLSINRAAVRKLHMQLLGRLRLKFASFTGDGIAAANDRAEGMTAEKLHNNKIALFSCRENNIKLEAFGHFSFEYIVVDEETEFTKRSTSQLSSVGPLEITRVTSTVQISTGPDQQFRRSEGPGKSYFNSIVDYASEGIQLCWKSKKIQRARNVGLPPTIARVKRWNHYEEDLQLRDILTLRPGSEKDGLILHGYGMPTAN